MSADRIYLDATMPRCSDRHYITLRETATKITIGYWVAPTPRRAVCGFVGLRMSGYVQLSQPVRNRLIEHVSAGRTAP